MSASEPDEYEVHGSRETWRILRKIQARATRQGRGEQVLQAIRHIEERLRTNPTDFGEPLYRLPAMKMVVPCALAPPLVIDFGVCEDGPIVFIKDIRLLEP